MPVLPHHSSMRAPMLLLAALLIVTAIEALPLFSSLDQAPPVEHDFTTLTPLDFISIPPAAAAHHLGLHHPSSVTANEPVLTRQAEPDEWLHDTRDLQRRGLSAVWQELSFPSRRRLPSLLGARVATAPISQPEESRPCKRLAPDHFSCDEPSWAAVQTREVLVDGEKTSCIWAHPIKGRVTSITYPDVAVPQEEAEKEKLLLLEVAFHDHVTKDPARSIPITITHGTQRARHTARSNRKGWQTFPVKLSADGVSHPLVLTIEASQPGRHQLCYRFETKALSKNKKP